MSLKNFNENPNDIKIKHIIEGLEVLRDLADTLSEHRFNETNSILVNSIKQVSKEVTIQMKQLYDGLKDT